MAAENQNVTPLETLPAEVITAARPRADIDTLGSLIHCQSADEEFFVSINNGGAKISLSANRQFRMPRGEHFTRFTIIRKTGALVANNSIVLVVGDGDYRDGNSAFRETIAATLNGSIADAAPVATGGANATLLLAASTFALRKGVKVVNTGTVPLRIAGTDADAKSGTKGDYIFPQQAVYYPVVGAIYAAGVGGVGACAVVEELW